MSEQSKSIEEPWIFLAVLLAVGFALYLLDYFFGDAYLFSVVQIRSAFAWISSFVAASPALDAVQRFADEAGYGQITWSGASAVTDFLGPWFRVIAFLPFLVLLIALLRVKREEFKEVMGIERFIEVQSKTFWQIAPIVADNPMKDKSGRWATRMNPKDFAFQHQIIYRSASNDSTYFFSEPRARAAFDKQLTAKPHAYAGLPLYQLVMFAGFVSQAAGNRRHCNPFLEALARCYAERFSHEGKEIDETVFSNPSLVAHLSEMKVEASVNGLLALLNSQSLAPIAQRFWDSHAYIETVMLAALQGARDKGGVRASADFIWLRPINRPLWYALNNLGRRSFLIEGAAANHHYHFELALKQAFRTKQLDEPIRALGGALRRAGIAHTGEG